MSPETLITGATGFVGACLARTLTQSGETLRVLVRPGSDDRNLSGLPVERASGDLRDASSLHAALAGIRRVYHVAAKISLLRRDRRELWATNAEGSARLAQLAREHGIERLVLVSTIAAVGSCAPGQDAIDEDAPYDLARYGIDYCDSKRAAEAAVLAETERGLDAVIVNPTQIFGPGDLRPPSGAILLAIAEGAVPFAPPGGINAVDVRDVVSGTIAAMEYGRPGERYLLGGENLTHAQLLEKTYRILGRTARVRVLPRAPFAVLTRAAGAAERLGLLPSGLGGATLRLAGRRLWCRCDKAERELGYAAYPIEMAIKAVFDQWLDLDQIQPEWVGGLGRV